jgi:pentapeptide MXKDX repeat protein
MARSQIDSWSDNAWPFSQKREANASLRQRELMWMCLARVIAAKRNVTLPGGRLMKKRTLLSAAITVGLAFAPLAPAAFADNMKKDTMSKDSMSKGSMTKDPMVKDKMSKDSMKKDDMSKDSMSKDGMKK